jgi:predicted GIY-YIG superfamily endonuclease
MIWDEVQENKELYLSSGINKLLSCPESSWNNVSVTDFGNYLIISDNIYWYIGESNKVKKRIKQHFRSKSSFFSTYIKNGYPLKQIDSFEVKEMGTLFGRKELEEFGIVNIPTNLNNFHTKKFKKIDLNAINSNHWNKLQLNYNNLLEQGENKLFSSKKYLWNECDVPDYPGVYIVFNGEDIIYIGESTNLFERYNTHSEKTYFSALRRHIGKTFLNLKFLQTEKKRKNREFRSEDDSKISLYLDKCEAIFFKVEIGRKELEEYLIRKYNPILNKKRI